MQAQDKETASETSTEGVVENSEAVADSMPSLEEAIRQAELKAEEHHDDPNDQWRISDQGKSRCWNR